MKFKIGDIIEIKKGWEENKKIIIKVDCIRREYITVPIKSFIGFDFQKYSIWDYTDWGFRYINRNYKKIGSIKNSIKRL